MKAVTNLIVAKDVATGNDGFIRVLKEDQTALAPGETVADSPVIYIEQEIAGSDKILSLPITGSQVNSWKGKSYSAEQLQVTTVTLGTAQNDTRYFLWIVPKSSKQATQVRQGYDILSDASATNTEIVTAFKTAINADTNLPITASGADTLVLTSDAAPTVSNDRVSEIELQAMYFDIAAGTGFPSDASVATGTVPDPGIGTFNQVRFMEIRAKGYKGNENRSMYTDSPTYYTDSGTTYDVYTIGHWLPRQSEGANSLLQSSALTQILVPAGASTFPQSTFETILNGWLASTPTSPNAVNL